MLNPHCLVLCVKGVISQNLHCRLHLICAKKYRPLKLNSQVSWTLRQPEGKLEVEEKGEDWEKKEIYWQERTVQEGKELKLEVEEKGQDQEKKGDLMAGEDNPGGKGLEPLGKSKIPGSEVNLKYPERVQDSCSPHDPVPDNGA